MHLCGATKSKAWVAKAVLIGLRRLLPMRKQVLVVIWTLMNSCATWLMPVLQAFTLKTNYRVLKNVVTWAAKSLCRLKKRWTNLWQRVWLRMRWTFRLFWLLARMAKRLIFWPAILTSATKSLSQVSARAKVFITSKMVLSSVFHAAWLMQNMPIWFGWKLLILTWV